MPKAQHHTAGDGPRKKTSPKPPVQPTEGISLLGSAKMLVSVIAIASSIAFVSQRGEGDLLTSYALCSRTGKGIYTVDTKNSQQQCLVVHEEHIVDTGDLVDIQQRWKSERDNAELPVRFIDSGSIVVPGMSDSHCHILEYGASKLIDLENGKSVQETVGYVAEYILANPDIRNNMSKVIEGWGFDHTAWASGALPVAADLDAHPITRGRPIILQGKDGHTIWVSPSILRANGPYPAEVDGGVVIRDAAGNPTGVFMDSAMDLIVRPVLSAEDLEKRFAVTVKEALSKGVVSLHDAGFKPVSLDFFKKKTEINGLPLRIYGMTYFDEDGAYWGDKSRPLIGTGKDRLTARSVKIFADGALRSGGAALYEPYTDNPSTSGLMRITPELLNEVVPKFLRDGWQVNIHAIGDRANGIVLDAFEIAAKKFKLDVASKRPRIEHVQIVTKNDMERLAKLGVIASVQPSHATDDMWYAEGRLGPERVKNLYAFRNILNSGARITLGTDFPVEPVDPLYSFFSAITRTSVDGTSPHGPGGWFPDQRLTREEALRGVTIDPAFASFTENSLGSIEPGKRADFVVLTQDIMKVPVEKILQTNVTATVIDGKPVYGKF